MRVLLVVTAMLALGLGCVKKPNPVPLPDMCVKVAHGGDDQIDQVLCAGRDEDGDEIDDAVDHCLGRKEIYNAILDRDGCPDPDADLDKIEDSADACPKQKGPPPDGCPTSDNDNDGIANHLDACPNAAEDIDGDNDDDGCPEGETQTLASALPDQLWSRREVAMRPGSAKPTRKGKKELGLLVDDVIARGDELLRARVVAAANRREGTRVAKRRARTVEKALVEAGLPKEKLEIELEPKSAWSRVEVFLYVKIGEEKIKIDDGGSSAEEESP